MTIVELYNTLEKAIDSGKSTVESRVYFTRKLHDNSNIAEPVELAIIDSDGDLIFSSNNLFKK